MLKYIQCVATFMVVSPPIAALGQIGGLPGPSTGSVFTGNSPAQTNKASCQMLCPSRPCNRFAGIYPSFCTLRTAGAL